MSADLTTPAADLTAVIAATVEWADRELCGYRTGWIGDEDIADIIRTAAPLIAKAERKQVAKEIRERFKVAADEDLLAAARGHAASAVSLAMAAVAMGAAGIATGEAASVAGGGESRGA